ncbi:MAG: DedA family protein [Lentisphaeria bacterium]|nr:DedA family protein [Lentisphaeria bacterium]
MTEIIASHIEIAASHAGTWGFLLIFIFMAVESSFIPFPSEVVMIPAGFLAYRGALTTGIPVLDLVLALLVGLAGSMVGAYINYFLAEYLGRPILYKYGKYFFLSEKNLNRAEEVFRDYGDITTFVCRLIPAIRQLISSPAGLSRMPHRKFALFTALGAGIWTAILVSVGWYLAHLTKDLSYMQMVEQGKKIISDHYIWILLFLAAAVAVYIFLHKFIMKSNRQENKEQSK